MSDSTKRSAASHPTTSTIIEDKQAAAPAAKAYNKPAKPGSTTTAEPISTTPKKPNDRFHSTPHLRGRLRHTSGYVTPNDEHQGRGHTIR